MELPSIPEIDVSPSKDPWIWTFRVAFFAFQLLLVCLFYWSTGHFVSIEEYKNDQHEIGGQREAVMGQLHAIDLTLSRIDGKLDRYDDLNNQIKDHETRIREIDRRLYGTHP